MSDPWAKPPRRPLPEHLENRILRELAKAPARRLRPRHLIAPLAAAALVAATAVGAASLERRPVGHPGRDGEPVSVDRPTRPTIGPSTPYAEDPRRSPRPNLDIRPMTKAEIKKDTKSCLKRRDPKDAPAAEAASGWSDTPWSSGGPGSTEPTTERTRTLAARGRGKHLGV